jgi:hypothetical protein
MTYAKAKLIIWNSGAYSRIEVKVAAVYILGSMKARQEDIHQASLVI